MFLFRTQFSDLTNGQRSVLPTIPSTSHHQKKGDVKDEAKNVMCYVQVNKMEKKRKMHLSAA